MLTFIIILTGLSLGSFGNNIISYFLKQSEFDFFRSKCNCCKKDLRYYELIPVLSYIILRGRCSGCSCRISLRYIVVEILSSLLALFCFVRYGLSTDFIFYFFIFYLLLLTGVIDLYSYKIPNHLVLALLLIVLTKTLLFEILPLINLVTSVFLIFIFIILNNLFIKLKDKEVIGYGDIKLIAVLTLALNFPLSLIGLWLSSLIAIPGFYMISNDTRKQSHYKKVPFGLYLSIGYIFVGFFENSVLAVLTSYLKYISNF